MTTPIKSIFMNARRAVVSVCILSCLVLAVPVFVGVFTYSTMTNFYFAQIFGGDGVFIPGGLIPFINDDILNYQALGLILVGFGWFQFISFPLAQWALKSGEWFLSFASFIIGCSAMFLGFWAGVSYLAVSDDYSARKNAVGLAAFKQLKIQSDNSAALTQVIAPRGVAIIQAEIQQKLNRVVRVRGKSISVGSYTSNCTRPERLRRSCSQIESLNIELAKARDYAANQKRARIDRDKLKSAVTIDIDKYYEFFGSENTLSMKKEHQNRLRHAFIQSLCEITAMFILPLMIFGVTYCTGGYNKPEKPDPQPAMKEPRNAAQAAPLSSIRDGSSTDWRIIDNEHDDPKTRKFANLRRYVSEAGCSGRYKPKEFITRLNSWCVDQGLPRFHQKEVGGVWEQLGGYKGKYEVPTTNNKTSTRTWWVIGEQPDQPQLKFGGV